MVDTLDHRYLTYSGYYTLYNDENYGKKDTLTLLNYILIYLNNYTLFRGRSYFGGA